MNNAERLERLTEIFDDLQDMPEGHIILVEGRKDMMALNLAGITVRAMAVQTEGGTLNVAEKLSEEGLTAVILTDWDKEGNRIANDLEHSLSSMCVVYDTMIRRRLRKICRPDIKDVESLPSFYSRLATDSVKLKEGRNK